MATKVAKEVPSKNTTFNMNGPFQDEVEILSVADFDVSAANSLFLDFGGTESSKTSGSDELPETVEETKIYKVLVTAPRLPASAMALLQETCILKFVEKDFTREVILKKANECDAIFIVGRNFRVDKDFLNSFDSGKLKVVAAMSNTFDTMDVVELSMRDIKIGVCRSVLADSVAEVAVGHALAIAHRIPSSANGILRREMHPSEWLGQEIAGSTAGIITMGPVGMALLCKLHSLKVSAILYTGNRVLEVEQWAEYVSLDNLVEHSDFIFETSELSKNNQNRFNENLFKKMKCTSVFVNVGHGGVVDTDALTEALKTRKIWGAGLDAVMPQPLGPNHPLRQTENCLISNRVGFNTEQTLEEMAIFTAFNILSGLQGEPMPSQVRFRLTPRQQRETVLRRKITTTTLPQRYAARLSLIAEHKSSFSGPALRH